MKLYMNTYKPIIEKIFRNSITIICIIILIQLLYNYYIIYNINNKKYIINKYNRDIVIYPLISFIIWKIILLIN